MNKISESYLELVGEGFTFDPIGDLKMVAQSNEYVKSLTVEDCSQLIKELDKLLMGNNKQ